MQTDGEILLMTNEENRNWGGKREGSGRKVGSTIDPALKKDHRIIVMCTKAQNDKLVELAKEQGLSVSAYILKTVLG